MNQLLSLTAACLVLSLPLHAAEEETDNEPQQQESTQAESPAQERTPEQEALPDIGLIEEAAEGSGEDDGNFVPSIRITEDLPVAFPVDI